MRAHIAELNRWLPLNYQWSWADCLTLCADWVNTVRGFDPAEEIRGTYSSAAECQRVTRFFTDPVGALSPRMERYGLKVTQTPVCGDVGIIMLPADRTVLTPHMAMCLGKTWAFKQQTGAVTAVAPFKIAAAWGIGYESD